MNNTINKFEYKLVNPELLRADPTYQRVINFNRVNAIVKNFDERIFNEPKVSKRDDGFYYVFDGDHSVAAHKIKFGKDKPIRCKVYYGLSRQEEMELFVQQNGISKAPTRTEKLRAKANYDDEEVKGMIDDAHIAGVTIEFEANPGRNKILAVDTAYQIYKSIGRTNYINMLYTIRKIWNGDADSFQMGILKGFAYIYRHYSGQMKEDILIAALSGYPVKKIVERAKSLQGGMDKRFAISIIEQYNKRKRSNRITIPQ